MHAINRRKLADASGFTLIELLVVMIIISILMAVAVPVFLGQKQKALGSNAKSLVKSVQDTMESCGASTTTGGFTSVNAAGVAAVTCDSIYVRGDEKGIAMKACNGANPAPPAINGGAVPPAAAAGPLSALRLDECWYLVNSTAATNGNDSYYIMAKTTNISGTNFGWFSLYRNSEGTAKRCGYNAPAAAFVPAAAAVPATAAAFPAPVVPPADGRRICATGSW